MDQGFHLKLQTNEKRVIAAVTIVFLLCAYIEDAQFRSSIYTAAQ